MAQQGRHIGWLFAPCGEPSHGTMFAYRELPETVRPLVPLRILEIDEPPGALLAALHVPDFCEFLIY